ncbi:neuromodulin [Colletes gigas]|uniref:neuromodulin n=1 Tax=Colletes gigas TaxID=935657 RepID=UPI001C9AD317|nr:neuromodulin [Colletes gigas]
MLQNSDQDMTKANVAATKIQANFRGYRVRKRMKESNNEARSESSGAVDRERKQREDGRTDDDDSSSLEKRDAAAESLEDKSATKIQARVRGFLVRKKQQIAREAATRIQAGFRGFKTRKLLKQNEQ